MHLNYLKNIENIININNKIYNKNNVHIVGMDIIIYEVSP